MLVKCRSCSVSISQAHHQHKTLEKFENMRVRMLRQKQIFIALFSLLTMQLAVANPLWTFDTLFVSEEEGLVRNIDYAQMQHSSEELQSVEDEEIPKSTKSNATSCSVVIGAYLPPRAIERSYEIFAKVLVRDSREATKNKLRELKSLVTDREINIAYIFNMLKIFNDVNVKREGESMYKVLAGVVHKPNKDNGILSEDTVWFDQIIDYILCMVLNAKDKKNMVDNLVDNYSMLEAISTHFDLFKKFWLDYHVVKRARLHRIVNAARAKEEPELYVSLTYRNYP